MSAKTPKLLIMLPSTKPGANERTSGQRTAPFWWWARTLEMEVKMMVDMAVAMAIFRPRSSGMLRADSTMMRKGTMIMPPPMPSNPAMKPVNKPSTASSMITSGSSIMAWGWGWGLK